MREVEFELYPCADRQKELIYETQHAIIFSLHASMEAGNPLLSVMQRFADNEADAKTKKTWDAAIADLKAEKPLGEVLIKTGFFQQALNIIFLATQESELVLRTAKDWINTRYS